MLCKFCQEDVRGTPCQASSQAARCSNNRDDDWPDDDRHQPVMTKEYDIEHVESQKLKQ
jgi:hypothetical protein